jgi:hypothetical protein
MAWFFDLKDTAASALIAAHLNNRHQRPGMSMIEARNSQVAQMPQGR